MNSVKCHLTQRKLLLLQLLLLLQQQNTDCHYHLHLENTNHWQRLAEGVEDPPVCRKDTIIRKEQVEVLEGGAQEVHRPVVGGVQAGRVTHRVDVPHRRVLPVLRSSVLVKSFGQLPAVLSVPAISGTFPKLEVAFRQFVEAVWRKERRRKMSTNLIKTLDAVTR